MSQVTEQSVRFQTALASIKLIQASAVLDLTEDDFDFLTSNKVWIATDRTRSRRFFFSSRRRHTRSYGDWSSDVCSSDLAKLEGAASIDIAGARVAGANKWILPAERAPVRAGTRLELDVVVRNLLVGHRFPDRKSVV